MSSDFWASYVSGALGILIGNRLDVMKVQAQVGMGLGEGRGGGGGGGGGTPAATATESSELQHSSLKRLTSLFRGAAAPVLGYGALNSILFVSFNRSVRVMEPGVWDYGRLAGVGLGKVWVAGAVAGLATWVVSAPSEYVKCRAQLVVGGEGRSWGVVRGTVREGGWRGLFRGGMVTSVRDAVGYGWYFWSYELCKRLIVGRRSPDPFVDMNAGEVLLAGGIAGVVTWVSIYPLDVVKTRVQTRSVAGAAGETEGLLGSGKGGARSSWGIAKEVWREEGLRGFYRGVGICSLRAFVVNAVQWYVYERIMAVLNGR